MMEQKTSYSDFESQ